MPLLAYLVHYVIINGHYGDTGLNQLQITNRNAYLVFAIANRNYIRGGNISDIIPVERIERKIYFIRRQKVMIDRDLAELYGVETRVLNQAVRRNIKRFPEDFMFHFSKEETEIWKSQIVMSNKERMGLRRRPYAFTQEGIAMLSGVLNSEIAIQVNIEIMRTFVKLRQMLASNTHLARRLKALEKKYDEQFAVVFEAIRALMVPPEKKKRKIGFQR